MKLLFCEMCRSAVSAPAKAGLIRRCECGKAAVWCDPATGKTGVHAISPKAVSLICVSDGLTASPFLMVSRTDPPQEYGMVDGPTMKRAIKACDPASVFSKLKTLVVRVRPTFSPEEIVFEPDPTKIPVI